MPAQARELGAVPRTIERDERSPDMTTRLTAQREDRTAARHLELTTDGIEADHAEARPVTHARDGVALARVLLRDFHALLARHLRAALSAIRRETMRYAPAQRRSAERGDHRDPALASDVPGAGSSNFQGLNRVALCPGQRRGWPGTPAAASVRAVKRSFFVLALAALTGAGIASLASACSSDSPSATAAGADAAVITTDAPSSDGSKADAASDAGTGTGPSTCEVTRAYTVDCTAGSDAGDQLTCGSAKFDAWCALNDQAINSDAYRRAEATCLTHANCDGRARRDCEYRTYAMATPTTAQTSLVAAYCQTCEPMDTAGCAKRKTTYDPSKGPSSTDDVFVAAWELNDTLADQIRTTCTGKALDGGIAAQVDGGAPNPCLKAFGNCAGDIYVNALPDCPK
jgi:hypothetical protein